MSAKKAAKSRVVPRSRANKVTEPTPAERLARFLGDTRRRYPTNAAFAETIGCTGGRLSQILAGSGGRVSPELALKIGQATNGLVPASAWRPDLWSRPSDVPTGAE